MQTLNVSSVQTSNDKDLYSVFMTRRGQFVRLTFSRPMRARKGVSDTLTKLTVWTVRAGVEYDNMKATIQGRADGSKPSENAGLSWGEWEEYPYTITHKGERYFRFAIVPNLYPDNTFFRNGKRVEKDTLKADCLASEFTDKPMGEVFTIREKNIISIV